MKKISLFLFLTISGLAICQDGRDAQLLKAYSQLELSELKLNSPDKYELLYLGLDNALEILDMPKEKKSKMNGEISLPSGDYTFASLGLKIGESNQYYQISGTDKMLLVKSFFILKNFSDAK